MKVLVTGGTGVVGESAVLELHRRGHAVRVLSRHADSEKWWPKGVEGWAGDVSDEKSIRGAASGCDAVVHLAGIVEEKPPDTTFQSVNIDGTRYVVLEAERSGVRKLIYVSSLGAERGQSDYHRSKYVAEDVVRAFSREWLVLRPGAVYGPGDEHVSVLLRMIRSLPVIPTIGDGNQQFQPVWHEDLAEALASAVEREDVKCVTLDIAGGDLTSQNDLVDRMRTLTNRSAPQAPLPEIVASWGLKALDAIGVSVPFNESQLRMLIEGNYLKAGKTNALTDVFQIKPTRIEEGLRKLLDTQPEQLPSEGVGALTQKRFWVDLRETHFNADSLFAYVRENLPSLMSSKIIDVKAEPHASTLIEQGETLTLEIPLRGHIQVRVAEVAERRITLLTVAGHPIAGAVRFLVEERGDAVRFEVQVYDRAASVFDKIMLKTLGEWLQKAAWVGLCENVARVSGDESAEVQTAHHELNDDQLRVVEEWTSTLSDQLSRNATSSGRD
jgi:nucleoside-diphosphate-sugar epimerase